MKEIWLLTKGDNWNEVKEQVKDAIEIGFTGVVVDEAYAEKAKKLGRIGVVARRGMRGKIDGKDAYFINITSADEQLKAIELSSDASYLFLQFSDWRIIPLENLIAMKKGARLIAEVKSLDDANVVLTTLEKGADGIAVSSDVGREGMLEFYRAVAEEAGKLNLKSAVIEEVRPLGVGERVCVDTVTIMNVGEGMLVGSSAGFMFLVGSESEESEYVASRPFRVNAGCVSAYVKVGDKTKYLAELKAGDEVEVIRHDGNVRKSYVGRVKIERRPLVLIRARAGNYEGTVILQNAETIKLVAPGGKHVSVAELKPGDEVLVWLGKKARHFGVGVDEYIIEK
ncbi:MAG: 3-dehydroquinate synthase II [Archaeoglobus sp.]|jgi:3-dehydroquinate synthase II|nr:MAG: 3-dehydroquinate synthase II [Archaeoglobus sp.]